MKVKNIQLLLAIVTISLIAGCARDKAAIFPSGYFLTPETGMTPRQVIKTNQDGSFDQPSAENVLKNDFRPIAFVDYSGARKSFEIKELDKMTVKPSIFQILEAAGRQFFALDADFAATYVAQLTVKANYQYMLEYQLFEKNPQYLLEVTVDPSDLMTYQSAYADKQKRFVALFSSTIVAPENFLIHELNEVQADVEFPVYFKAKGGMFKEVKKTLGHRFIMRKYADPDIVKAIIKNDEPMFVEADQLKEITYGDKIPPIKLIFAFSGKKYTVSDSYSSHLTAEGVYFKNPKPSRPSVKMVRTFEDLEKGLVPITTADFVGDKGIGKNDYPIK